MTLGDADFVGCAFKGDSGSSTASMDVWKLLDSIGRSEELVVAFNTDTDLSETTSFIPGLRGLKIGASTLSDDNVVT